jgi:methionyl-tRNA synthetase
MTKPFYITTPIYYVNDVPHLGHAYTTLVADSLARFHRMRGDDTRFLTGTDEHGQKVEQAANDRGLTPQQLVDQVAPRFNETWQALGIEGYRFIRTTEERHKRVVRTLWQRIRRESPDDLYLASYQGWYCVGCEAFYTESQLNKDGDSWVCQVHKKPVAWLDKERSWFFRLSNYAEPLLRHIEANPEFIRPEAYRNEIVAFLNGGLRDLSVSRTSFRWGIPAPEADPEGLQHVIYVWMDALINYLTDLCPPDGSIAGPEFERYFPQVIHLIGKDILRFHSVYWPAFLLAAKLPLPKGILAHGWWTVRGEKISKSMPATRIDPLKLADALAGQSPLGRAIGVDAMRYYLLREMPLGNDGDFTFESLFGRFNAELANDLGNLINRSLTLIAKFRDAHPPAQIASYDGDATAPWAALEADAATAIRDAADRFTEFAPSRALEAIWRFVGAANRFVDAAKPWEMAQGKGAYGAAALPHALWALQSSIWVIARLIAPVLPEASRYFRTYLGDDAALAWPELVQSGGRTRAFTAIPALSPKAPQGALFPRLDDKLQQAIVDQIVPPDAAAPPSPPASPSPPAAPGARPAAAAEPRGEPLPPIKIDEFNRLELRVGIVLSAQAVPKAKKLLQLSVDLGEPAPRSIVAGVAEAYAPDQIVGKQVIVVANLEPATIRGVASQGMILAAGDAQILGLSALDRDVPAGTRVR